MNDVSRIRPTWDNKGRVPHYVLFRRKEMTLTGIGVFLVGLAIGLIMAAFVRGDK